MAEASADQVTARKYFQPSADHHVQFEFRVVCAPEHGQAGVTTIAFANGLQDQYNIRKVKESASLGVGGLGSLSLPVEGSTDSMVKVGSETVSDDELYQRFFDLVAQYIDSVVPPEPEQHPDAAVSLRSTESSLMRELPVKSASPLSIEAPTSLDQP